MQLDPLNNFAYYFRCLTYYTKKDINNSIIVYKKYTELLGCDNILAKTWLFHLEYLLNKNSFKDLIYGISIKFLILKIINFLLLIGCKIYIELKMYHEAKSQSQIWIVISEIFYLFGFLVIFKFWWWWYIWIVNEFSKCMYKVKGYLIY
jgi:hypothetical protein